MSMLSSIDVNKYSKKFDVLGFGCDYLRLSFINKSDFIEMFLELLDCDNSNFGTYEFLDFILTYQKIPCKLGMALTFSLSYNEVSVPLFQFVKFDYSSAYITGRYGKLDFYGQFFRLGELGLYNVNEFISNIVFNINSCEDPVVTRYDYKIDFFSKNEYIDIPHWDKIIKRQSQSVADPKYIGDTLTNWLVGKKDTGTYCVRMYDKLLDCNVKDKYFLYQDFFEYKSVQRLEIECQRNFLKGFHLSDFIDGLIQKKIESILHINNLEWSGFVCYHYDSSKEITDKNKSRYIRRYNTQTKKLAKNKINPFMLSYEFLYNELEREELEDLVKEFLLEYINQGKKDLYDKFTH